MAQHDMDVANAAGAGFRSDINAVIAALVTNSSGATEPTTTFANQWWADTTANILKRRNVGNTAWIEVLPLTDGAVGKVGDEDIAGIKTFLDDVVIASGKDLQFEGTTAAIQVDGTDRIKVNADGGVNLDNPVWRAHMAVSQSIANNTNTKIIYGTEIKDSNGNYDPVTGRMTATVAGDYLINASVFFASAVSGMGWIYVYKNGAQLALGSQSSFTGQPLQVIVSEIIELAAGDYVEIYVGQNSGGSINANATPTPVSNFSGALLKGA